jgi:4-amino-4-deoxy-L-arabinose transferase-like glycosyltransferase
MCTGHQILCVGNEGYLSMKQALRSVCTLPIMVVFGLAVMVRFIYNVTVAAEYYPDHDSLTYQTIAYSILKDHCYCLLPHLSTVDRAPLWPAIIAVVYALLGDQDRKVRFLLCVVGAITCVLIYCFARDLFGRRVGLFSGLLAAVYPYLYMYDGWLYSESVYTCLLLAFCYTIYRMQRKAHWGLMVLGGVLLALLSLTRPNGLIILVLFLMWAFFLGWRRLLAWRVVVQSALIITGVTLVLIAPWTARNYVVTGTFVPIAVGDGKVLIGAYNDMIIDRPDYLASWVKPWESRPSVYHEFPDNCARGCEVAREQAYKLDAEHWVQTHLNQMPRLLALHFVNLWQIDTQEADLAINRFPHQRSSMAVVFMMHVITPVVFLLAAIGVFVARKRWPELLFFYLIILVTIAQSVYFYGMARFRAPMEPMLIILSAATVWWIQKRFRKQEITEEEQSGTKQRDFSVLHR